MDNEIVGKVLNVLICNDADSIQSQAIDKVTATFEGFPGDKHYGWTKPSDGRTKFYPRGTAIRNNRQISIVSLEELDEVSAALDIDFIKPEWVGANLLVAGIPELTKVRPNSRMFFSSGAVLLVTSDNLPCGLMTDEIMKHIPNRPDLKEKIKPTSMTKRGLVAVVELPGQIQKGDEVRVVISRN